MLTNSVRIHAEKNVQNSVRIHVEFWIGLDAHKFSKDSRGKDVYKLQYGFMRENRPKVSVRIHIEFWLGLDARKFSKEFSEKLSTNFSKD